MSADCETILAVILNNDDHNNLIWNQLQAVRYALNIYKIKSAYHEMYRNQREQLGASAVTLNNDDHTDLTWNQLQARYALSIYTIKSTYHET